MKRSMYKVWLRPVVYIFVLAMPIVVSADRAGRTLKAYGEDTESNVEVEIFGIGDSTSNIGDAQVGTSGVLISTEHENDDKVFSLNLERWNYTWVNPESLGFAPGITGVPWTSVNTIQLGFDYEDEIGQWELNYYIEAESSFEKEMSGSYEYETGIDFTYQYSDAWIYTVNVNIEYLDADGAELGLDVEIEWNQHSRDGWSGEFELSSEFPEIRLRYHFSREFSTTFFYNESGTNTIRLSDSSPVPGMQGGYFEDQFNALGATLTYELSRESYLSFRVQQNTNRVFSLQDKTGQVDNVYEFGDSMEIGIKYLHTF